MKQLLIITIILVSIAYSLGAAAKHINVTDLNPTTLTLNQLN